MKNEGGNLFNEPGESKEVKKKAAVVPVVAKSAEPKKEEAVVAPVAVVVPVPEPKKEEAIVPVGEVNVPAASIEDLMNTVEARLDFKKRMIQAALKQCNEEDFVLQGTSPYLEVTAAEKIAPIFGIRIIGPKWTREDGTFEDPNNNGKFIKYFRYWYECERAEVTSNGSVVYSLEGLFGSAASTDAFFGMANGKYLSLLEIDPSDIRKKAYSDLMRSAVVRLLGLRSLTIDELKAAGIDTSKIKDTGRGIKATPEEVEKQNKLVEYVKKLVGADSAKVSEKIKALTFFKDGTTEKFKTKASELTGKWLENTLRKAVEEYNRTQTAAGGGK